MGAQAKTPPRNLVMKMPAAVLLVAVPMLKRPKMKQAGSIDHLRPYTSLIGAHTNGPRAKPTGTIRNSSLEEGEKCFTNLKRIEQELRQ